MNTNTQALREALERIKSNLMHTRRFGVDDLGTWRRAATQAEGDIEELLESHPPAPEQPSGEHPVTLTDVLQKRCYEWGTYWRSSDAHGVKLNTEQALELLRDALGVEVEIAATPTAEPAVEAVPKGWKLVPVEPSSDMLDRAVAFALMSVLTGDYKWSQYMTDLWGRFLSAVPAAPEAAKPVDMVLYCPKCGAQHIDAPDERTPDWSNPPHKSHLCHGCGHVWRPSDTPTNGVAACASGKDADTAPDLTAKPEPATKPLPGADWTIDIRRRMACGKCSRRECRCKPEDAPNCIWWDEPGDAPQTAAKPEQQAQAGCDYCNNPMFAGFKCDNCGRKTEQQAQAGDEKQ